MVTTKLFEEFFNPDFHYDSRGLATKGFGTRPLVDILENLQRLYRKSIYQEFDAAIIFLNKTMNQMQPVEVMLIVIEEVKLFLLANPDKDCALTELNLISYALIKLKKLGGCMPKASRNGKKGHRRIGENRPNSQPRAQKRQCMFF